MNRILQIIIAVVVIVVIAGASFYGGMVYGQNRASTASAAGFADRQFTSPDGQDGNFPGFRGQNGDGTGGFTAQPGTAFGQIESIEGNTLTVTDRSGNQVQVQVADTTLIEKNASVSVTDLVAGDTVMVSGSENDDGTITARSVQVAPAGRFFGGNPNGAQNGQ
ncbi:MAG: DUF5666 domain-containing protein [Anaerolineae bacterium]